MNIRVKLLLFIARTMNVPPFENGNPNEDAIGRLDERESPFWVSLAGLLLSTRQTTCR